jgi:hypothetical protein
LRTFLNSNVLLFLPTETTGGEATGGFNKLVEDDFGVVSTTAGGGSGKELSSSSSSKSKSGRGMERGSGLF